MSDRRSAELAVIEAARAFINVWPAPESHAVRMAMASRVRALDSLPAAPAGETERVRIAVFRWPTGELETVVLWGNRISGAPGSACVAIITADIPTKPPTVPEVAGSVEG